MILSLRSRGGPQSPRNRRKIPRDGTRTELPPGVPTSRGVLQSERATASRLYRPVRIGSGPCRRRSRCCRCDRDPRSVLACRRRRRLFQNCWLSGKIERYPSIFGSTMDRLEAMSIALAVAETGSLSAASRREKTPLATVSRKLSELEAHLETKLFNRTSRALVLTDAGRSFVAAAKRILADVAEVERAASGEYTTPRGGLTVSAPVDLGRVHLLPVVAEFLAAFPQVDVELRLQDRVVNLLEEEVDVALRIGALADSSLIAVRVGDIRRLLCASPASLKSPGMPKSPDDLARHDCITYVAMRSPDMWKFKR